MVSSADYRNVKQPLSANERIKGKGHRRREVGSGGEGKAGTFLKQELPFRTSAIL